MTARLGDSEGVRLQAKVEEHVSGCKSGDARTSPDTNGWLTGWWRATLETAHREV